MDILPSSNQRIHDSDMELCRARLAGKFCIAIVCALQFVPRLFRVIAAPSLKCKAELFLLISVPNLSLMILVIVADYLLFRKFGPRISAKYAKFVDITLLLLWTVDWSLALMGSLLKVTDTDPPAFEITGVYAFTNFSWKALLLTLIVQKWQLKMIPPLVATVLIAIFTIYYTPHNLAFNLIRSGFQLFLIIFILYYEDKIKWRMIWTNLKQEKWMQVNEFILNNIPENIMILNSKGDIKFISDYCKSFMKKCQIPSQDSFIKISDLQQFQQNESEFNNSMQATSVALQIEKLTTNNDLFQETEENISTGLKIEDLQGLITNFQKIIDEKNLQEREFLMFNGKLKMETSSQDKSIEIKISFIQHFKSMYIILILRDTTQRDRLITLEKTNKYKDQLLASVSHELRAPLNGNLNLVEAAVHSLGVPENIKEDLLIPALHSGKFLLHIINDILDLSQIKQKKLRLVFESTSLKKTLKNAAQLVELQAKKKGIELVLELDSKVPAKFCTDHTRLSQVVLNLLSNAIKFTKEGIVKLAAVLIENSGSVRIIVEDSGVGIQKENLQKLFSSETDIECEEKQAISSTKVGLGLNIASNLAALLAPKSQPGISVSSIFNKGSTFSFVIENKDLNFQKLQQDFDESSSWYEIAEEVPGAIQPKFRPVLQKNESSASIAPLVDKMESCLMAEPCCLCSKVLIVDDNPFNTMAFETILSSLKIKCDSVFSGSACIEKLLKRHQNTCEKHCRSYSVVFMDQEMPEMTGSETVVEIRRLQRENLIPEMKIIGCTAHKAKDEVERFFESGLDQCIFKPISVMLIKNILKEILSE